MPRSGKVKKNLPPQDAIYKNRVITKLINKVMLSGRKSIAEGIVYGALDIVKEKENKDPIVVFTEAMKQITPKVEVKSRRIGGASYQVPVEVKGVRKDSLTIRWLVDAARARSSKEFRTMREKLAAEIIDASKGIGEAVKKRETAHKMAEANRAFAHFRW